MPSRFSRVIGWLRLRLVARPDPDAEMSEEIRLHLDQRIAEFIVQGLSPDQARTAAYQQFGPVEPVKEACRHEQRRAIWIGTVWQDLRYGARSLARDRAFTIAAVLTLTLGVGLFTSFFTVFNAILLKPWPLPEPATLVTATRGVSPTIYRYLRARVTSVDLVGIADVCASSIDDELVRSTFRCVSGNYFDVLRVPLVHGRGFRPDEDIVGAPVPVAVISYGVWGERFSFSPDAIGRTIRLNQIPFQIVGIAARGATDKPAKRLPRLWVPLAAYPLVMSDHREFLVDPERCCVELAGRLREPGSEATVSAQLTALHRQLDHSPSERPLTITGTSEILQPWEQSGVALIGLMAGGLLLVLLVACANTGNLQLARGARRRTEFLVRLSLGASRRRIVRQLLTEGLLLAGTAAALSLAFARVFTTLLARWLAEGRPDDLGIDLSLDWRVSFFTVAVVGVAVLATELGPALRGTRRLLVTGRSTDVPLRARSWFLIVQVGLSAVLIVGASLLGRALLHAAALDPGFDAAGVARMSLLLPSGTATESRLQALRDGLRQALVAPGPPLIAEEGRAQMRSTFRGSGARMSGTVVARLVSPQYHTLLRVPLREGRLLRDDDTPAEVVVNEAFARNAWPGQSAIGARFDFNGPRVVVGVVGDMRPTRAGTPVPPAFFERGGGGSLFIRNDAVTLARARAALAAMDPAAGLRFTPLSDDFEIGLADMRIGVALAWALGLIALAMSAAGIFGVFALVAEERRREVGIRLALGAGARAIVQLMLTHAGRALLLGLLFGFVAALLAAPLLRSYLLGVAPHDPVAFAVAVLVLVAAAAAATFIPIRRTLRVNPAVTLRPE